MPDPDFLVVDPAETLRALDAAGPVDLVVGIPSYREADSIAHVVRQCDLGIREFFPDRRAVIINADNNSPDGTELAFRNAGSQTPLVYLSTPPGVTGKGNNFWNLLQATRYLEAEAMVAVDADLISIGPMWIRSLAGPLLAGECDYITPLYARNEYDGTITNNICYPLVRGTLGTRIRQPIGGDFGLSGRFAASVLEEEWLDTTREFGIDIFLTCCALLGDFEVAQTNLGAKVHKPSAPKLGPMFTQVVNTLFSRLTDASDRWLGEVEPRDLPVMGTTAEGDAQDLAVDFKAIKRTTLHQYRESAGILGEILAPERQAAVASMMAAGVMDIDAEMWCQCVYDLFHAYATDAPRRPAIVEALKPLFFARVASFYKETLELGHRDSEARIGEQAELFLARRDTLLDRFTAVPLER